MRTVMSNSMVAHTWAAQSQDHARSASMSFRGRVLYSYSTPIAAIHDTIGGEPAGHQHNVVLFTDRNYSMTTSNKHMPAARSATSHLTQFVVPDFAAANERDHLANLDALVAGYVAERERVRRKRDVFDWSYDNLRRVGNGVLDYARTFALPHPVIDAGADIAGLRAYHAEREARLNTPENKAERAKREARRIERQREARRIAAMADAEDRMLWLKREYNGRVRCPHGGAMLRLSADGRNIETSWGIRDFPIDQGVRMLETIGAGNMVTLAGMTCGARGEFTVRHASPAMLQIGCHTFYADELRRFGHSIGAMA